MRGACHFHNYSGTIDSIDNVTKEIEITLDGDSKVLKEDELKDALFGQGIEAEYILSNTVGSIATLQFPASSDLSKFDTSKRFMMAVPTYQGSFMADPTASFSITKERGVLGQTITAGSVVANLTMTDASNIPNQAGWLVFNFGKPNEESLVR